MLRTALWELLTQMTEGQLVGAQSLNGGGGM